MTDFARRALCGTLLMTCLGSATAAGAETPTFAKDVAPILYKHCVSCHRPGEVAPMSLLTYEAVRPWVRSIKAKVATREMPPGWMLGPDTEIEFSNDARLAQRDIDTIVAWVDAGAPRGASDQPLPALPALADEWRHPSGRPPDLVIELPTETDIPATGVLPNFTVRTPVPASVTEERWLEASEWKVDRAVTHHAILGMFGPAGERDRGWLGAYFPGQPLQIWGDGVAKRVIPGGTFTWNMHYTPDGHARKDRARVGLWWARGPVKYSVANGGTNYDAYVVGGTEFLPTDAVADSKQPRPGGQHWLPNIPANDGNFEVIGMTAFTEDILIRALWPHAHQRAKDFKYVLIYPDGHEQVLLDLKKYDYLWQQFFKFKTPLRVPAGSKMVGIIHYDNSSSNKYNVAPGREVLWSEQSWDEMFSPEYYFSVERETLQNRIPERKQ